MEQPQLRVCARCHTTKPATEFPIKDKVRGTFISYCRPCRSEYGKEHYRKNVPAYMARSRARSVIDRARNRQFVAEFLCTHPCVDCGEADIVVLEFDHRDADNKRDDIGRLINTSGLDTLKLEIEKCDVRCGNCHRIRTAKQFGWYRLSEDDDAYLVA